MSPEFDFTKLSDDQLRKVIQDKKRVGYPAWQVAASLLNCRHVDLRLPGVRDLLLKERSWVLDLPEGEFRIIGEILRGEE